MGNDPKVYEFNDVRDFVVFLNLLIEITIKYLRKYDKYYDDLEKFTISKLDDSLRELVCSEEFDLEKYIPSRNNRDRKKLISEKINYWELKSLEDKLFTPRNLLLNAFADRTSNGVSYWRFRKECEKKAKLNNKFDFDLTEFDEKTRALLNDLGSLRNYEHHMTDAKFIEWRKFREGQLIDSGAPLSTWPTETIEVNFNNSVDIVYLLSTYLSSRELKNHFKQLLQCMKRDYSKLVGRNVRIFKIEHEDVLPLSDAKISINGMKRHEGKLK